MHTWVIYICIFIIVYLVYQYVFGTRPSYYVRRMKYMMEQLEPKEEEDVTEDIQLNTELWVYQYTSMHNMLAHMLERFDYHVRTIMHKLYLDFILPMKII